MVKTFPKHISVVVLYNLDPEWTKSEKDEVVRLSCELGDALQAEGYATHTVALENDDLAGALQPFDPGRVIIFNWCEGLPGIPHSEWLVAKKLEDLGFTFTGSGADVLALAQDKQKVKTLLREKTIATPAWKIFSSCDTEGWTIFPAIVKPRYEHCSVGITSDAVVLNPQELKRRISYILKTHSQPALVEDFIDGREFHVSVWGNEKVTVLPAAEMDFSSLEKLHDRVCTYESKFVPGSHLYEDIKTVVPAVLTKTEEKSLREICSKAYKAVGCRDYARMDVRLRKNIFYILDVNPNADISPDASMASAAEAMGMNYGQMASVIVQLAALRHPACNTKTNNLMRARH